ncbi:MAG: cellulose biosynthesis protein BcsS [Gallionellaceae bacterium]|jgi:hypothetical protein|nr:cellulose biosynthesis protein BcsS [Gallionellaceae bacterium]
MSICLACLLLITSNAARAENAAPPPVFIVPYAGADVAPRANYTYGGVVMSLNGDLTRPGFAARVFAAYGEYENRNFAATSGRIQGHVVMSEALVGYQTYRESYRIGGYIGLERQDVYMLMPDLGGVKSRSAENGVKVLLDFETLPTTPYYLNAMASYSEAFNSYWIRLRPGRRFGAVTLGPELTFQGNREGNNQRAGIFAAATWPFGNGNYFSASLSGGYALIGKQDFTTIVGTHSGAYGSLLGIFYF